MKGRLCLKISRNRILLPCVIFLSLFFCFFFSGSTYASDMQVNHFNLSYKPLNGGYQWSSDLHYNDHPSPAVAEADGFYTQWAQLTPSGNTMVVHYEVNFVWSQLLSLGDVQLAYYVNQGLAGFNVGACDWGGTSVQIMNQSVSTAITSWDSSSWRNQTLTIYADFIVSGIPQSDGRLHCYIASDFYSDYPYFRIVQPTLTNNVVTYFEKSSTTYSFSNQIDNTLLQGMVNQNQTIINQNNEMNQNLNTINDTLENQDDKQQEKYENQSSEVESNINDYTSDSETQATNLITLISSVITAINDSTAGNCIFRFPSNLFLFNDNSATFINLCPNEYTRFINTSWTPHNSIGGVTIKSIFSNVVMVVFLISVVISILHAIKKLYGLFLGGSNG